MFVARSPNRISLTNCTFTGITFGVMSNSEDYGGILNKTAINIIHSTFQNSITPLFLLLWNPFCIINISRCTFQMNNYGALAIYEILPANITATITDCTFQNNNGIYGGAVIIISKGKFLIANSTFVNNSATVSNYDDYK